MEDAGFTSEHIIKPWNLYRWFVAESMTGWRDYMAWLEERLRDQVIPFQIISYKKAKL